MRTTHASSRRQIFREVVLAIALAVIVFSPGAILALAQAPASAAAPADRPQGVPDLIGSLNATPGVLGVDAAQTQSGKQVIFAWFENKQAVLNWFYSDAHQKLMQMFSPGASSGRK